MFCSLLFCLNFINIKNFLPILIFWYTLAIAPLNAIATDNEKKWNAQKNI
jgi:hypothetical protein